MASATGFPLGTVNYAVRSNTYDVAPASRSVINDRESDRRLTISLVEADNSLSFSTLRDDSLLETTEDALREEEEALLALGSEPLMIGSTGSRVGSV